MSELSKYKFRFFTDVEVAEWLRISVATLRTMRSRLCKDPLPFTKIKGRVFYREDLLLKWIERNTFDDTQQAEYLNRTA